MKRLLRRVLTPLTLPLSWPYRVAVAHRNRRYDRSINVTDVGRPVISVGNITVGGTGKSPAVQWVCRRLIEHGHRPAIALRGYGAAKPGESDEARDHARQLPEVPLAVNPDRVRAIEKLLVTHPEVTVVLLDDGFQHRRVARALDLVLIDATRPRLCERLLPAGLLREPIENLRRADAVVVTRAAREDAALAAMIEQVHGRAPVAWSTHSWRGLDVFAAGGGRQPVEWLAGRRLATMLGVGHPASIIEQIRGQGATVVTDITTRDHARYDMATLATTRRRCEGLDGLVVTSKDWVKLERLITPLVEAGRWQVPVIVPDLRLEVFAGAETLETMLLDAVGEGEGVQSPR